MLTRELVAEPANIIYPESFVERVRHLADLHRGARAWRKGNGRGRHGALLGVSQGSVRDAQLLVLICERRRAVAHRRGSLQGVDLSTPRHFDQPAGHGRMKCGHVAARALVVGAMRRSAGRKPRQMSSAFAAGREYARRPTPSVRATRHHHVGPDRRSDQHRRRGPPRSVRRHHLGAKEFKPRTIVDLATLTGAMVISWGMNMPGSSPMTRRSPPA